MMKLFALIFAMANFMTFSQISIAAEPMGRLFTSPAERSNLDYLRKTKKLNAPIKAEAPIDAPEAAPIVLPEAVNLQGYVKRNDGKQGTIWVNDQGIARELGQ